MAPNVEVPSTFPSPFSPVDEMFSGPMKRREVIAVVEGVVKEEVVKEEVVKEAEATAAATKSSDTTASLSINSAHLDGDTTNGNAKYDKKDRDVDGGGKGDVCKTALGRAIRGSTDRTAASSSSSSSLSSSLSWTTTSVTCDSSCHSQSSSTSTSSSSSSCATQEIGACIDVSSEGEVEVNGRRMLHVVKHSGGDSGHSDKQQKPGEEASLSLSVGEEAAPEEAHANDDNDNDKSEVGVAVAAVVAVSSGGLEVAPVYAATDAHTDGSSDIAEAEATEESCCQSTDRLETNGQLPDQPHKAQSPLLLADKLRADDKLLEAARILRSSSGSTTPPPPPSLSSSSSSSSPPLHPPPLPPHLRRLLSEASAIEALVSELTTDASTLPGWKTWFEAHGGGGFGTSGASHTGNSSPAHRHRPSRNVPPRRRHSSLHCRAQPDRDGQLTARVETPVERSLLVPLLSVLNETDLYSTWLPDWSAPRFRVRRSTKLRQTGRCSQVLVVTIDVPWPLGPREAIINAVGCDDIDEAGHIAVRLGGIAESTEEGGREQNGVGDGDDAVIVPPLDGSGPKPMPVDFRGGFLFRKCPRDHPALVKLKEDREKERRRRGGWGSIGGGGGGEGGGGGGGGARKNRPFGLGGGKRHQHNQHKHHPQQQQQCGGGSGSGSGGGKHANSDKNDKNDHGGDVNGDDGDGDDHEDNMILVSFAMYFDVKAAVLPPAFVQFIMRTALGNMWHKFLRVAEDVRDGRRPMHASAIESKREELYDWVEERVRRMLDLLEGGSGDTIVGKEDGKSGK